MTSAGRLRDEAFTRSWLRSVLGCDGSPASLVVRMFEFDSSWHRDGMDYVIAFTEEAFAAEGIRKLEDFLLIHAAFAREWPENE
jgi:hypothetical protein